MTSWFDENNPVTPNQNQEPDNAAADNEEIKSAETSPPPADSETAHDQPAAPTSDSGWRSAGSYPGSWSSGSTQETSSTGGDSTTYHYGVNSSNPVPNSTNQYTPPAQSYQQSQPQQQQYTYQTPGGYRPQNNQQNTYDPYGWQRSSTPGGGQQPTPAPSGKPPRKKKKAATIAIASIGVVCAAAIVTLSVLLGLAISKNGLPTTSSKPSTTSSQGDTSTPALEIVENDADAQGLSTRSIVQMNLDSTVVVSVYSKQNSFGFGGSSSLAEAGAASGIVMRADGYIITNWHVVINEKTGDPYDRIDVTTYDGTVYKDAKVVGADADTDLAVIKVSAVKLTPPEFGDSSKLQLGDKVVAIGNAGGLSWTTTQGIVSGLARDVYDDTGYAIQCLQIDAAINPGNSGGPLLNSQGQVVGINSAKIVAQGYEGLGFSIPIKEAKIIIDDLIQHGYVKNRVMLGVTGRDITQPGYEGFQIVTISDTSCLKGTDVKVGDVIVGIGDTTITSGTELRTKLTDYKVGDTVKISLFRVDSRTGNKTSYTVTVKLTEYAG